MEGSGSGLNRYTFPSAEGQDVTGRDRMSLISISVAATGGEYIAM